MTTATVQPVGWLEMTTMSTESATFQGCGATGETMCPDGCYDTQTDQYHCGSCCTVVLRCERGLRERAVHDRDDDDGLHDVRAVGGDRDVRLADHDVRGRRTVHVVLDVPGSLHRGGHDLRVDVRVGVPDGVFGLPELQGLRLLHGLPLRVRVGVLAVGSGSGKRRRGRGRGWPCPDRGHA